MIFKNWIDVLLRKLENGLQDAELADALDRISQFIMGPDAYKKLKVNPHFKTTRDLLSKVEATEDFKRYKHKSCNVTSEDFWLLEQNRPLYQMNRRSRSGVPELILDERPSKISSALEFGKILIEDGKPKEVTYIRIQEKNPITVTNTIVAILGSLMG